MLVFVYGTLKSNFPNHHLLSNLENGRATFVVHGKTEDKYPMVVTKVLKIPAVLDESGIGNFIEGEVWDVDEKMLATLDRLELHPRLYGREIVNILTPDKPLLCHLYIIKDYCSDLLKEELFTAYTKEHTKHYVPPNKRSKDDYKTHMFDVLKATNVGQE